MAGQLSVSPRLSGIFGASDPDKGALKLVTGVEAVTVTSAVDTGLSEIIAGGGTSQTTPASTNSQLSASFSAGTLTLACWETDHTVGTTAANISWWALGYASPAL